MRERPAEGASRTSLAARTSVVGVVGRVATLALSLVSRTVFIRLLGTRYLGVNGLYSDILTVLSLSELGIGAAMTFALYKPVALHEDEKIRELLAFYRRAYRVVALATTAAGLALLPFLPAIVRGGDGFTAFELRLYFVVFLANTASAYFVSYKYGLVSAMQQNYVQTLIGLVTSLACEVARLVVLLATESFLAYLLSGTLALLLCRVLTVRYLDARYPILAEHPDRALPRQERSGILREVRSLFVHQLSNVIVHATSSIIIAAAPALGIGVVGLVSNYNAVVNNVSALALVLVGGVTAGFGNLAATATPVRFAEVFDEMHFASFWLFGICSVCLFVLLPPFIVVWIGRDYLIDDASFLLMIVNFYLQGQCSAYNNARIAKGQFGTDSGWALAQATVSLVVSVGGAVAIGLPGVYVGMVASRLVLFVSRPCVTSRLLFERAAGVYFRDAVRYLLAVCAAAAVCHLVCRPLLARPSVLGLFAALAVCLVLTCAVFLGAFRRSAQLVALAGRLRGALGGRSR